MVSLERVKISGLRSIDELDLPLRGLSVLIGPNGTGKSTIIEALELLRRAGASSPTTFIREIETVHGGLSNLLRRTKDLDRFRIGIEMAIDADKAEYSFAIRKVDGLPVFDDEVLTWNGAPLLQRQSEGVRLEGRAKPIRLPTDQLVLPMFANGMDPRGQAVVGALANIDVHVPFATGASWAARAAGGYALCREPEQLRRTTRLERFGANLANAYFQMTSEDGHAQWAETMEYIRLGLGDHVQDIRARVVGEGYIALNLRFRGIDQDIPISSLSDGEVAYLAFVALFRLARKEMGRGERTLLAFDEPEMFLHPATLARVVGLFEREAKARPVVIATHSDALLDALSTPDAVRVCEMNEARATTIRQLDADSLREWLADYRGVGALRAEGYLRQVVAR
jgi:predicted ATPase